MKKLATNLWMVGVFAGIAGIATSLIAGNWGAAMWAFVATINALGAWIVSIS